MIKLLRLMISGLDAVRVMGESPLFDRQYYSNKYHVPRRFCVLYDVLLGRKKMNDPSEEFSAKKYMAAYPDIKASRMPALYHYLKFGKKEGRSYESTVSAVDRCPLLGLFDAAWYKEQYGEQLHASSAGALDHYLSLGWQQGFKPFENFELERFRLENPACKEEPLTYWYKNRLPGLYFADSRSAIQSDDRMTRRVLQYLYHYSQDAAVRELIPEDHAGRSLTVFFAPDFGEQELSVLFSFQALMERALQSKAVEESVVAVTMPGTPTYTGDVIFPPWLRILRYGQLSFRMHGWDCVSFVMPDTQFLSFSEYLKHNPDEPVHHCKKKTLRVLDYGRVANLRYNTQKAERFFDCVTTEVETPEDPFDNPYLGFFDRQWYAKTYFAPKGRQTEKDAFWHYMHEGWRTRNKPFQYFDIDAFYGAYPACSLEPLYYLYRNKIPDYFFTEKSIPKMHLSEAAGQALQALYRIRQEAVVESLLSYEDSCSKLMLILVSPEDAISGGIMSFYGIYHLSKELSAVHGRTVIAATIPGDTTHAGFTMFENDMPVLRYDLVTRRLHAVKDVLVMLPETYVQTYLRYLTGNTEDPLLQIEKRQLNIMNQRIELMPEPDVIEEMKLYFPFITQTAAHFKYCTQHERDYYGIPTHLLLPPIIKHFTLIPYEKKENIFAYSYDEQPWKKKLLATVKAAFPELRFVEIRGMSFDEYLALIHRAKWCMTFGEGLDGYFSEPYQAGGISFAVWNDEYFTERYRKLPTVLPSADSVTADLPALMRRLDNKTEYERVSALVREVHGQEYAAKRTSRDQLVDFFEGRLDYP